MVRTADAVTFRPEEQAILDAFDGGTTSTVIAVVQHASASQPPSLVREAYWELVSEGVLVPSASGAVQLRR